MGRYEEGYVFFLSQVECKFRFLIFIYVVAENRIVRYRILSRPRE
jgi:hypothetical protein